MGIGTLFLVLAAICFALAAFGFTYKKLNFIAAGLFFWVLASIV
jgi:hypothetical protein